MVRVRAAVKLAHSSAALENESGLLPDVVLAQERQVEIEGGVSAQVCGICLGPGSLVSRTGVRGGVRAKRRLRDGYPWPRPLWLTRRRQ